MANTTTTKNGAAKKIPIPTLKEGESYEDAVAREAREREGGAETPPPAVLLEAWVREHAGVTLRAATADQLRAALAKESAPRGLELLEQIRAARPDLGGLLSGPPPAEEPARVKRLTKKEAAALAKPNEVRAVILSTEEKPGPAGATVIAPFRALKLAELRESETNPRKTFGSLEELVASIRSVGVLQPLLVREVEPIPGDDARFEVVCGARRFRAAKKAGLQEVPVVVRALTDPEALEAQIVENVQREDVSPLEEAEGYEVLHKTHGYDVETIAKKVGKTRSTVYARMKLTALCDAARTALRDGVLTPSVALLIARIPAEKLQRQALEELTRGYDSKEPVPFRWAAERIAAGYSLDLKHAPFDTEDPHLNPEIGACGPCPYRSGNCPELTPETKSADVCTNPTCYQVKTKAHLLGARARAEEKGRIWIEEKEARTLFSHDGHLHWNSEYAQLDQPHPDSPTRKTWKSLLGKELPAIYAAATPKGRVVELVRKKDADALIRKGENPVAKKVAEKVEERAGEREQREKEKAAAELRGRVGTRLLEKLADQAHKKKELSELALRLVAERTFDVVPAELEPVICRRFAVESVSEIDVAKLTLAELCSLATLGELGELFTDGWGGYSDEVKATAKGFGLDLRTLEKEERAAIEAEAELAKKAKAEKKKAAGEK